LPGLRNFEDKGDAGCELTWKYFYPALPLPMAVRLIGDYDKWALKMPDSKVFYEGMKLLPNAPDSDIWIDLLADNPNDVYAVIKSGRTATTYRDNYCAGLCKSFGYEAELDGHHAYACNQYMFGSGGFGERFGKYPLCIAYIHDGKKFTVSLYSETVDVGAIAKAHGGGGHKGASGFVCETLPFQRRLNP
jgi:oligoribonuclease NrnB/cAMP/cGMP phosphodiesterase (DHH superfamily)